MATMQFIAANFAAIACENVGVPLGVEGICNDMHTGRIHYSQGMSVSAETRTGPLANMVSHAGCNCLSEQN